jgi:hypothetical protein
MIDTIKLTLTDGMFEVLDRDKFQPNADVVLRGFFAAMITVPTIFY